MNRRLFLLGSGSLLAGTWASLQAQPTPETPVEPIVPRPEVNPAVPARADQEIDKTLIDDTDIGRRRVDEDEASPSDVQPPRETAPLEPGRAPHADVPPALAPSAPPYVDQGIGPSGCMPCQPMPMACPPQPCQPVCYPRRRHHHRRRRGCW